MRSLAIVGGGPAGLFLARMVGLTRPDVSIDVYERNGPGDVFGFGVTLSDRTMRGIAERDPVTHRRITDASTVMTGVEVRPPGHRFRYDGFGGAAISRFTLLTILREQAEAVGTRIHFHHEVDPADPPHADVVAVADGANSAHRADSAAAFGTRTETGTARYIWLGSTAEFDGVSALVFEHTPWGPMAAHCYTYGTGAIQPGAPASLSTVVVELDDRTWRSAGLHTAVGSQGEIDPTALDLLTGVFAEHLGGHKLISNFSRWGTFTVVRNTRWHAGNTVLLGDAAHTAHFTVSSGTKLAMEDSLALAAALAEHGDSTDPAAAFAAYQAARAEPVGRTQRWAEPSMYWWETYGRRMHLPAAQFGLHFVTRTAAVSYLGLRRRCAERVDEAEAEFFTAAGHPPAPVSAATLPLRLGAVELPRRVVDKSTVDGVLTELACPIGTEREAASDELVRAAAATTGVLLRADPDRWHDTLRHASRVRTEAGVPVAVLVPAGWSDDLARDPRVDPWPTRIHLALVTGRIDLAVVDG